MSSVSHTHTHTRFQYQFTFCTKKTRPQSSVWLTGHRNHKTVQHCEMLTRHGLGAVLSVGHCHFNRWTALWRTWQIWLQHFLFISWLYIIVVKLCGCEALSLRAFPALGLKWPRRPGVSRWFWTYSKCLRDAWGSAVIWQRKHALTLPCQCKQKHAVFTIVEERLQSLRDVTMQYQLFSLSSFFCPMQGQTLTHMSKRTCTTIRRAAAQRGTGKGYIKCLRAWIKGSHGTPLSVCPTCFWTRAMPRSFLCTWPDSPTVMFPQVSGQPKSSCLRMIKTPGSPPLSLVCQCCSVNSH